MKKIRLPNFGTILLGLAALVNMARWVGVFTVSQNGPTWISQLLPILDAISGLFTGLTVAGGLAFVTHRLGGLQPFTPKGRPVMRFWGAAISAAAILIMSAFLLPPYVRMTMPDELKAQIGDLGVWSVMAVLVGDLIIVAIALADSKAAGFTRSSDEQGRQETGKKAKVAQARSKKNMQVARKRIADDELLAYLQEHTGESDGQIAEHFGVKRQAIQPRRKKLMPQLEESFKTKVEKS